MVVVGHSFGGAVALKLAVARPDLVASLVLLDPAVGLDGAWMRKIADQMMASPDYPDRDEARNEKASGSWGEVDARELDAELDEHLVELPDGRLGWRISIPAMMSYWSELARDFVLPHKGIPTTLIRATRTDPPYVTDELITALQRSSGPTFTLLDFDCDHMVAAGQTRRDGRGDSRPARTGLAMAAITDEQVETVRALVASIPPGRVSTYGDIAVSGRTFQPAHRRLDHAHGLVGPAMAPGDSAHRVGRRRIWPPRQLELLRAEGVLASDGRVPLDEVRHEF